MKIKLSTKLTLSIVAVEAAMLFILVWNNIKVINNSYTQVLETTIKQETELLANALSPGLAAQDIAFLKDTLSLIKNNKNFSYAIIDDYDENLLAYINLTPQELKNFKTTHLPETGKDTINTQKKIYLASQYLGELHVGYSLKEVTRLTRNSLNQNIIFAFFTLLFSIITTILIANFLNARVNKLRAGAEEYAKGNLHHRINISGTDELNDLANQFNTMAESLAFSKIELEEKNRELQIETSHLKNLMNSVNAVVLEAQPDKDRFTYVSDEAQNLLGYPVEKWLQPDFWYNHIHPDDLNDVRDKMKNNSGNDEFTYTFDYRMRNISGNYIWVRSINNRIKDDDGSYIIRGLLLDINDEKKNEQHIIYLAEHDTLTGLLNRRCFQEKLDDHIALAKRYNYEGAVLFIDLDQFKYINDTLGHHGGDEYLAAISVCLKNLLRDTDILGRLGGDEFGIILARSNEEDITEVCTKILKTLQEQVFIARGVHAHTSASIGVAIFPRHSDITDELLAQADAAMYDVKAKGRNNFSIYDDDQKQILQMHHKVKWEERIRNALKNDHFRLFFQPIVDVTSGKVIHHEVLLRMFDPEKEKIILPGQFLDTAERFGLIREIDLWVIENALRLFSTGKNPETGLSINISGFNFGDIEFLNHISDCIKKYKANTSLIIFEVTETAAVSNIFQARKFVEELRLTGCRFALDDFGVGFSSLHYLRNLPVDFIKIDGSFIKNLATDKNDQTMVHAITHIAKGLGIKTIAEFVENEETFRLLKVLNVDFAQGYFIDKPGDTIITGYKHLHP